MDTRTQVFAVEHPIRRRRHRASERWVVGYCIKLVARETNAVVYKSVVCADRSHAISLAKNYLNRRTHRFVDTTRPGHVKDW